MPENRQVEMNRLLIRKHLAEKYGIDLDKSTEKYGVDLDKSTADTILNEKWKLAIDFLYGGTYDPEKVSEEVDEELSK